MLFRSDPQRAVAELRGAGINTSYSPPDYARHDFAAHGINGLVRLSPHVYNTEDELDTTLDHITRLVGRAAG